MRAEPLRERKRGSDEVGERIGECLGPQRYRHGVRER